MTTNISEFIQDPVLVETAEKISLRFVFQAIRDFGKEAFTIFANAPDDQDDVAEDVTRDALDRLGATQVPVRLYGRMDYKKARYLFHEDWTIRQALLVDSKAEKGAGNNARIQTSQTSMEVRQVRQGNQVTVPGDLPQIFEVGREQYLTTTVFVKYHYSADESNTSGRRLDGGTVFCIPNGCLQSEYNPTHSDNIWNVGPNSPQRGETFRTRVNFAKLRGKRTWRVQQLRTVERKLAGDWSD